MNPLTGRLVKQAGLAAAAATTLLMASATVEAAPVTLTFTGTVGSVDSGLSSQFTNGQTLSGSYTFEPATAAVTGSTSAVAAFDALTALNFDLGGYTGGIPGGTGIPQIIINNGIGGHDGYGVVSTTNNGLTGANVGGFSLVTFALLLDDDTGQVFSDALTLPGTIDLTSFSTVQFALNFSNGDVSQVVKGELTSLSPSPIPEIPEPCTLALLGTGLIAIAGRRRRESTPRANHGVRLTRRGRSAAAG
jgi:hypothetical protein